MSSISSRASIAAGLLALGLSLTAHADEWEIQQKDPVLVKTRARPGTDVKEVWADGIVNASPIDIQDALTDVKRFPQFMPYMTEAKLVGETDPDGAIYVYSKLDLPVLSARDFVHKSYTDRDATKDPEGVFANHWFAVPDKIPRRKDVIRLVISEGSWSVTPLPGGKSHVVYHFAVDPGGSVPSFIVNRNNTGGVVDTYKNVEKEARRRAAERTAARRP